MNDAASSQLARIARQNLETSKFLGVDFVPWNCLRVASSTTEVKAIDTVKTIVGNASGGNDAKAAALDALRKRHDASCPHCTSVTYHTQTVFGEGDPNAQVMFIGEAPGEEEDRTGRPFVGRAGQKLDEIIRAMKLNREDVYIANILKSRPPENRAPLPPEVDSCSPFLAEQIRIIQPRVIVALGNPASKMLLKTDVGITRLRGQWGSYADGDLHIPVMPTFHPAYILRNYTVETRQKVWSDMQAVLARIAEAP
jgi:uracil-DNA glycosylase